MLKKIIEETIKELLLNEKSTEVENFGNEFVGKLVMVRTYSAGVHFGTLKSKDRDEVVLNNSHRVHYWVNACSLSQLANQGSQNKNSENRISVAVDQILLTNVIEIIEMKKEAFDNLTSVLWKK